MKKLLAIALAALLLASAFTLTGCRRTRDESTLVIGATAVPHAVILEFIRDDLYERGITLEIIVFSDFVTVNPALADGQLDANYFQHIAFLENWVRDNNRPIVNAGGIHVEPMGVYSERITDLDDLRYGAEVGIPGDAVNGGRALALLQNLGLITLREGVTHRGTVADIVDNPLNLVIREITSELLPRTLPDLDIALINTNWALQAGLSPTEDTIAREGVYGYFTNVIAVRNGDQNDERIAALIEALSTQAVRDFIYEQYLGRVVPVF